MEAHTEVQESSEEEQGEPEKPRYKAQKTDITVPLLITLIGIFCYLGVVLPSVFESTKEAFHYSVYDLVLMVGGAVLVGLGTYFWFKARTDVLPENNKKAPEYA